MWRNPTASWRPCGDGSLKQVISSQTSRNPFVGNVMAGSIAPVPPRGRLEVRAAQCPFRVINGRDALEMGCLHYPRKQTSVSYAADCDAIVCYGGAKVTVTINKDRAS